MNADCFPAEAATPRILVGLMSGTSVDAIDACCVRLHADGGGLRHEILGTYTHPMPAHIRQRLFAAMRDQRASFKELCSLDSAVGALFAEAAVQAIHQAGLPNRAVDAIASHGQTLFHQPPAGEGTVGSTLQIGNPALITEYTGIETISNFRIRDMAVGGQGAPLVPLADAWLFQHATDGRCIQNIGGIANVTVLPAKNTGQPVIAFDTGPGNMLIDGAMRALFNESFDRNGDVARSGRVDDSMLLCLADNDYFSAPPPKSTGRELFGDQYLAEILAQFAHVAPADIVATLTELTARTLVDAYAQFVFPQTAVSEIILGGGGGFNQTLKDRIADRLARAGRPVALKMHQDYGIPDQYKEALAFAILGWATRLRLPGNIPSCTGAARAAILGNITPI